MTHFILFIGLVFSARSQAFEAKKIAKDEIPKIRALICQSPVVQKEILQANQLHQSSEEIQELDERWKNTVGEPDFILKFQKNECGQYLKKIKTEKLPYLAEIFVMDHQGGIVCQTDKTSDFWQGDETKWQAVFGKGENSYYIADPHFDESSQSFTLQVSLPIYNERQPIGTVTVGIDLDRVIEK